MTGFGQADGQVGATRVTVEARTVNHRFFSPSIKLPGAFSKWETEVREAMRTRVSRGHVTLTARTERVSGVASGAVDNVRFAQALGELRALTAKYGIAGDVDLASVLRMPDVMSTVRQEDETGTVAELIVIVERALDALQRTREEEGGRLAEVLEQRLGHISRSLEIVRGRAPERLIAQRDRLRAAVRELMDGIPGDEQRIAQEIAILADRLDVSEEMDRFVSHVAGFQLALREPSGEPVGKRLGFILQEMLREANTTGSKAGDVVMLNEVVAIKEELERIREQVENLE